MVIMWCLHLGGIWFAFNIHIVQAAVNEWLYTESITEMLSLQSRIFITPPPPPLGEREYIERLCVCPCVWILSGQYLLNYSLCCKLLPNLVWWYIVMVWNVMQKNWFAISKVKVTARAYVIKVWLFLLYPLNFWSACNQIWFDGTLSWARVASEKIGLFSLRLFKSVCSENSPVYF